MRPPTPERAMRHPVIVYANLGSPESPLLLEHQPACELDHLERRYRDADEKQPLGFK